MVALERREVDLDEVRGDARRGGGEQAAAAASPRRFGLPLTAISAASSATSAAHLAISSGTSAARESVSPISVLRTSGSSSSGMRIAVSTFS